MLQVHFHSLLKGTLSKLWPQIDMPFTESGMTPDVIINPNAFPSRMTIGMLVESMAGKSGALHAMTQDGTPFRFNEKNTAVNLFGEQLVKAGYNYYGNEPMYSGVTGEIFAADIYIGVRYFLQPSNRARLYTTKDCVTWSRINSKQERPVLLANSPNNHSRVVKLEEEFVLEKWSVTVYLLMEHRFCSTIGS